MALGSEKSSVQKPLIRYAVEGGWTYIKPDDAILLRLGESNAIFHEVLASQLQRLNPGIVDPSRAEEIIRRLSIIKPSIEGNHEAWEFL
jgi:type I restriction enzyme R subunit